MAKKTRPSFSAAKPAAKRDTAWVYRTDGAAPAEAKPAARSKAASRAKPVSRAKPAAPAKPAARARPASPARPALPASPAFSSHYDEARAIVRRYAAGGALASAIPLPLVDLAAVGAVHVLMVRAIAAEYGVPFDRVSGRAAIAAVAGGAVSRWIGRGVGRSALKALPGIGALAGAAAMPASTGAATYALGRIVVAHFESGGSLRDLDADAAARHARAIDGEEA
jgi:uncharacterized protein (DUF697 family)